jgi:hypothetical protein
MNLRCIGIQELSAITLCFGVISADAAPIVAFSQSTSCIGSGGVCPDSTNGSYENNISNTGALVQSSRSSSGPAGTESSASVADLANASLKAGTSATLGDGSSSVSALARARFGDSFTAYQGDELFTWTDTETVKFSLALSGSNEASGAAVTSDASFLLRIMKPGGVDAYARWVNGDSSALSVWQAATIGLFDYALGTLTDPTLGTEVPAFPATIDVSFAPGGNFDWVAILYANSVVYAGDFADYSMINFLNTATLSYTGLAGIQTYSGSGLFPGTLALPAIPIPASLPLLAAGVAALIAASRRWQGSPSARAGQG